MLLKHTAIIIRGYTEMLLESITHSINFSHAFERSHQFCVNNLNEFRHLSAWLDCNDSWPLPPASVHLIRPLLTFHGLCGKKGLHTLFHSPAWLLCREKTAYWSHSCWSTVASDTMRCFMFLHAPSKPDSDSMCWGQSKRLCKMTHHISFYTDVTDSSGFQR